MIPAISRGVTQMKTKIEPFSAEYLRLPHAKPVEWPRERVVIPTDLYTQLEHQVEDPVLKLNGVHYRPSPEKAVPAETVAVPETLEIDADEEILVARSRALPGLVVDEVSS